MTLIITENSLLPIKAVRPTTIYCSSFFHISIEPDNALTKKDRVSTYQRVLGVSSIDNTNEEAESNSSFLKNFSKTVADMLEFYKFRQLTQAIQNIGTTSRTPVANLTTFNDDIVSIQQNIEPYYYSRNLTNTFLGIATVYGTICLVSN